jgi:hypothetical protein
LAWEVFACSSLDNPAKSCATGPEDLNQLW